MAPYPPRPATSLQLLPQVQPEFSLRILDDGCAKQNRTIAAIQVGCRMLHVRRLWSAALVDAPQDAFGMCVPATSHEAAT